MARSITEVTKGACTRFWVDGVQVAVVKKNPLGKVTMWPWKVQYGPNQKRKLILSRSLGTRTSALKFAERAVNDHLEMTKPHA